MAREDNNNSLEKEVLGTVNNGKSDRTGALNDRKLDRTVNFSGRKIQNKYAIHAYTHGPVTGSGSSASHSPTG